MKREIKPGSVCMLVDLWRERELNGRAVMVVRRDEEFHLWKHWWKKDRWIVLATFVFGEHTVAAANLLPLNDPDLDVEEEEANEEVVAATNSDCESRGC